MHTRKSKWSVFLTLLFLLSTMTTAFAAEYIMTPYEIVKSMMLHGSSVLRVGNVTTHDEATVGCRELVDTFDGIASGYTPRVQLKVGYNQGKTETVLWQIEVMWGDNSELEQDKRIIEELEQIKARVSVKEKIKEIDRFIKSVCEYDKDYLEEGNKASETALGALNGKAICQGYANLASFLYDQVGIKNVKVRGNEKKSGIRHVWNMIELDGCYYVVDTTWNETRENFLLISPEEYSQYTTTDMDAYKLFYLKYDAKREYAYTLRTLLKYI